MGRTTLVRNQTGRGPDSDGASCASCLARHGCQRVRIPNCEQRMREQRVLDNGDGEPR